MIRSIAIDLTQAHIDAANDKLLQGSPGYSPCNQRIVCCPFAKVLAEKYPDFFDQVLGGGVVKVYLDNEMCVPKYYGEFCPLAKSELHRYDWTRKINPGRYRFILTWSNDAET